MATQTISSIITSLDINAYNQIPYADQYVPNNATTATTTPTDKGSSNGNSNSIAIRMVVAIATATATRQQQQQQQWRWRCGNRASRGQQ